MNLNWSYADPRTQSGSLPDNAGIYVISVCCNDDEYRAVYVGKADDIKTRCQQHFSDNESNKELKEYINKNYPMKLSYALVSKENDRNGIENYLVSYYEPKFNTQQPQVVDKILVNLPNVKTFR